MIMCYITSRCDASQLHLVYGSIRLIKLVSYDINLFLLTTHSVPTTIIHINNYLGVIDIAVYHISLVI